jgi:hypothetical protein
MGFVFALLTAGAAMFIGERLDSSFRRLDELRSFAQLPILATIPRIVTRADIWRSRMRFGAMAALLVVAVLVVAQGSYQLGRSGDQLVWMFTQRGA